MTIARILLRLANWLGAEDTGSAPPAASNVAASQSKPAASKVSLTVPTPTPLPMRTPESVRQELAKFPRRALIGTTVVWEGFAVQSFLKDVHSVLGKKNGYYEFGVFPDPAGDWLVVHAITSPGNNDAGLALTQAHQEFGSFEVQMFVGVAGSLKEDIAIGSVVAGDHVYNGHSGKVEDTQILGRPKGIPPDRGLLAICQAIIRSGEWRSLIRPPVQTALPDPADYPCPFPPTAFLKSIASGEEVLVGGKSPRYAWIRTHLNDCGAVEMEGYGAMKAAEYENTPAIIIRGISDMCAGKDHAADELNQPIAASHAAAFAFGILSFHSRAHQAGLAPAPPRIEPESAPQTDAVRTRRFQLVLNFDGKREDWDDTKIAKVVERFRTALGDENAELIRIDAGSVRLVLSVREGTEIDITKLRAVANEASVSLLGAIPAEQIAEADAVRVALANASIDLLSWERNLPGEKWIERPEQATILAKFGQDSSLTVLLGVPGSGKSALLSRVASDLISRQSPVLALKADVLAPEVNTESDLQQALSLPALPSELLLRLSSLEPVFLLIDQLDALASQIDLRSGRLNVLLNLVRRLAGAPNVHILLSARLFEFNHDARLRMVDAESVELQLPAWHEVKQQLAEVGIDAETWPESAREVVRIPQALKTYIVLAKSGRTEPSTTYPAMLERFWQERIASATDGTQLTKLATDIAEQMANEEVLWLGAARFDERANLLRRLESLGLVVRSENELSIAFSHQTIFDHVLSRTFLASSGSLSNYVLARQDSLFVRSKLWSALNYLRGAEPISYERELQKMWEVANLRRHLRLLLVAFMGQVSQPTPLEFSYMSAALGALDLRISALKAIAANSDWFSPFGATSIRDAMSGDDTEANLASSILANAWRTESDRVLRLIKECWLPRPEKDSLSWNTLKECPVWTDEIQAAAETILLRTPIAPWSVSDAAMSLATSQPAFAFRLLRAKLDFWLREAKTAGNATEFRNLLDSQEWHDLPSLAGSSPAEFLKELWPWYLSFFHQALEGHETEGRTYLFPGRYVLEIELHPTDSHSVVRERPLLNALQAAIEAVAGTDPSWFRVWVRENSDTKILPVQQLIAYGFEIGSAQFASEALAWLLEDARRFELGTVYDLRETTTALLRACASRWSKQEIGQFEKAVASYRPEAPANSTPDQRKAFADFVRVTRKELLKAVGLERLTPENQELVAMEERALGDRHTWAIRSGEGGLIGSPMDTAAMGKAKDRDILKIFNEIPDSTDWDHPKLWARGGNIQLSRAFAEFARTSPERATRLIEQFEPRKQERAASYALDSMAKDTANDERVIECFLDLHGRGFGADEFIDSATRAIEEVARRKKDLDESVIGILLGWLKASEVRDDDSEAHTETPEPEMRSQSLLWGLGGATALPGGNFTILSTLATILLNRGEEGRDLYFQILTDHLARDRNPKIWRPLLYRLSHAGGSSPGVPSAFFRELFDRVPGILETREGFMFLAYAQHWNEGLVFELIAGWRTSTRSFLQQAYGELVGLVAMTKDVSRWTDAQNAIISDGADRAKVGLAHAAVNLRSDTAFRLKADEVLIGLLKRANKELVAVVMDFFRIADELTPDTSTVKLLRALANPEIDMSAVSSLLIVERLGSMLPHEAELVAKLADKLVAAWRTELSDFRTATAASAPYLTDLALTLHRIGGASREAGVRLFEAMIDIDAYGARDTLAEIDGRFGQQRQAGRRRIARRPKRRRGRA